MIDGYYTDHVYQFFCILVVASFGGGGRMVRDQRLQSRLPWQGGQTETKWFRDFSHFDKNDLEALYFSNFVGEDVNETMNDVIGAVQSVSDKHAPLWKLSKNKTVS